VNQKLAASCPVLVRMIAPSWPIVFYDLAERREQITFVHRGFTSPTCRSADIVQPQGFVPIPFPSSSKREVVCEGFPYSASNSALVFTSTRTEVIFRVLWEPHRFHRKFAGLFTKVFSGFSEPRVLDILYSRLALFVVAFLQGVSLLWGRSSPKK
jgi:hypothetical protein